MKRSLILTALLGLVGGTMPILLAGDLSQYRNFRFGMTPSAVVKQAGGNVSEKKVIHKAPALIEEIVWSPQRRVAAFGESDSVKEICFRFYNGELFQMAVAYDRYKTAGLTAADLTEAISASTNSVPTHPNAEMIFPSTYNENVKVLSRWEDANYAFNLVRVDYEQGFAMILFSKQMEGMARAAALQAVKLEEQQAPQREIELQKKQEQDRRVQEEKTRLLNKPGFRP